MIKAVENTLEEGPISVSFDITNSDKFSKETVIYYVNSSNEEKYIVRGSNFNNITKPSDFEGISKIEFRARSDSSELNGTVVNFSNIQVESGSVATEYESYGYKIPVSISGKNLLVYPYSDTTKVENGVTFTDNGDGSVTVDGVATEYGSNYFCKQEDVTKYRGQYLTFSLNSEDNVNVLGNLIFKDADNNIINIYAVYSSISLAVPDNASTMSWLIKRNNNGVVAGTFKPQLELGNQATVYEKYVTPQNVDIYLGELLRKIGEQYADYIDWSSGKVVRQIYEQNISSELTFILAG